MKPIVLCILDGCGLKDESYGNAFKTAKKPNFDFLWNKYPHSKLEASGEKVGLPHGQMGNSEVGHMNIGSGRLVYQPLELINSKIKDKTYETNKEILSVFEHVKKHNSSLHLCGLLSDGGVHSHINHLFAIMELCKKNNISKVYYHVFLDGRDTLPESSIKYLNQLENKTKEIGVGSIATITGRFYAMDRDNRWDRVEKAYNALVKGEGIKANSAIAGIEESYQKEIFDEFVEPTVICNDGNPVATISENDSVIFFNYRKDRAREITRSLVDKEFDKFEREYFPLYYVCFTTYDATIENVHIAFKEQELKNTYGEMIAKNGLKQLRIAETEKYAHVTFFFNGGEEKQYPGEDRILVPSPKVATYDLQPEMSAIEVTDKVVEAIESKKYDTIILNYANPDMVGHTGVLEAAIKAIETIDECVGRVVKAIEDVNGVLLITADHGNSEQMIDYATGEPHTAHTTNPVPLILVGKDAKLKEGRLADLAPTMLDILGIEKPEEMTGESLIEK